MWAAEAGTQRNWVTADQYGEFLYYATAGTADTTACTWNGHTTDATRYILNMPGAQQTHGGQWNTNVYRMSVNNAPCIILQVGHIHFEGLQFEYNYTTTNFNYVFSMSFFPAGAQNRIYNCLVRSTGGGSISGFNVGHANANVQMYCNIIGDVTRYGIYQSAGTAYYYNNTIYGATTAGLFVTAGATAITVIDNIIANTGDDINNSCSTFTIDYNATDDGDGTNAIAPSGGAWTNEFTNPATRDFTLLGTGNCAGGGANDPGSGLYSTDIIGTAFTAAWDVGAHALISITYFDLAGSIAGTGTLSGSLQILTDLVGSIAGTGTLSGSMIIVEVLGGSIAGTGTLSGNIQIVNTLSGELSGVGTLSGFLTTDELIQTISKIVTKYTGASVTCTKKDGATKIVIKYDSADNSPSLGGT